MRQVNFHDMIKLFSSRNSIKPVPYRTIEDNLGIDHSTLQSMFSRIDREIKDGLKSKINNGKKFLVMVVLILAMVGQMSSRTIATVVKLIFGKKISHDTVLAILKHSGQVAREIHLKEVKLSKVKVASFDEAFQSSIPILGFVDNFSTVIVLQKASDRTSDSWEVFIDELLAIGLNPSTVITDGGAGMKKSLVIKFGDSVIYVLDLFHLIKKLREARDKMLGLCYSFIAWVYKLDNENTDKRILQYRNATSKMNSAIELFDSYEALLKKVAQHVYLANDTGEYISSNDLLKELKELAGYLKKFHSEIRKHKKINDARSYLENNFEKIIAYKQNIELDIKDCYPSQYLLIMNSILPIIEYYDRYERSYEDMNAQKYWADKIIETKKNSLEHINEKEFNEILNEVSLIVSKYAKSNSIIENINNQIRRFLDTYKTIPSWFCDLYSLYWNFHRFTRGKRKGYAPIELLTNKRMGKCWLDLLLEKFPYHKIQSSLSF